MKTNFPMSVMYNLLAAGWFYVIKCVEFAFNYFQFFSYHVMITNSMFLSYIRVFFLLKMISYTFLQ